MRVNNEKFILAAVVVVLVLTVISCPTCVTALTIRSNRIRRESPMPEALEEEVLVVTGTAPVAASWMSTETENSRTIIPPEIYSFRVQSDIRYRYSRTLVTSRVANKDANQAQEVTFSVVLPETAFISKFVMEIDGTAYEAYVKEKEQAKRDYVQAQRQGQSAGLVEKSTRNANVLNVNVHVKQQTKVTFNLTYEELLARKLGHYEQAISINPDQVASISDYQIVVNVEESEDLAFVRVPSLSNDIDAQDDQGNNPDAIIERTPNTAKISWSPTTADQKRLRQEGTSGKFLVEYDVDRKADAGQVLLMEGYFVHFFAPESLPPLRKHVVFILDISGSMSGRRLEQLKESQNKILEDLSSDDYFNIVTFSSGVYIWLPDDAQKVEPFPVTPENVKKAKYFIRKLEALGGTNIHDAIMESLSLIADIKEAQRKRMAVAENAVSSNKVVLPANVQSLIIFLTDGEPTVGITGRTEIQSRIRAANQESSVPIYSLGFGEGVDMPFLKKLSLQNSGFGRKIYEASDAALQLKGFYAEIASPLLSNVTFSYTPDQYNVTDLTVTKFPIAFGGSEIAVAGRLVPPTKEPKQDGPAIGQVVSCDVGNLEKCFFNVNVGGKGREGEVTLHHVIMYEIDFPLVPPRPNVPAVSFSPEDKFLERLWAYLTISQLIEQDSSAVEEDATSDTSLAVNGPVTPETPKQKALRLALKYGFVTPLTSLVVVKPNSSDISNAESYNAVPPADTPGGGTIGNSRGCSVCSAGMPWDSNSKYRAASQGSCSVPNLQVIVLPFSFIVVTWFT